MSLKPQKFVGASLVFPQILGIFESKVLVFLFLEELTLEKKKKHLRDLKFSKCVDENIFVFLVLY